MGFGKARGFAEALLIVILTGGKAAAFRETLGETSSPLRE
jgi:hypothetical protein